MRNLKKVLSLALALVMLVGMMVVGAGATSFKDAASIKNQEAVDVVSGIGVLQGDDTGNFNPEGTLTRAEASVVIAKLDLGAAFGNLATTNASSFSDVPAGYWGKPYIDYCAARGLIAGVGGGRFDPDAKVTGVQFALMVCRVLGYEDGNENITGANWETAAAALARKAGLTNNVALSSQPMTRDDMAQVAFNALQADMVEYSSSAITIGDLVIPAGKAKPVESDNTVDYNGATDDKFQLCEEKFPKLELAAPAPDDFDRPVRTWTYGTEELHDVGTETVVTYTGSQTATQVVKDLRGYKISGKTMTDTPVNTENSFVTDNNGTAGDLTINATNDTFAKAIATLTENGKVVEIYDSDDDKAIDKIVTVTYSVGELAVATAANGNVTYRVGGQSGIDYDDEDTADTVVLKGAVEDEDVVTFVKPTDGPLYIYPTTSFTGTQTAKNTTKKTITVSGETYEVGQGLVGNFDNGDEDANYYVDQYGYVVFTNAISVSKDYAYVVGVAANKTVTLDNKDAIVYVRAVLTDGTVEDLTLKTSVAKAGDKLSDGTTPKDTNDLYCGDIKLATNGQMTNDTTLTTAITASLAALDNVFTYSTNSKGLTSLTALKATAAAEKDVARVAFTDYKGGTTVGTTPTALMSSTTTFVLYNATAGTARVVTGRADLGLSSSTPSDKDLDGVAIISATKANVGPATVVFGNEVNTVVDSGNYAYVDNTKYTLKRVNGEDVRKYDAIAPDGNTVELYEGDLTPAAPGVYSYSTDNEIISAVISGATIVPAPNATHGLAGEFVENGEMVMIDGGSYYAKDADTQIVYVKSGLSGVDGNSGYMVLDSKDAKIVAIYVTDGAGAMTAASAKVTTATGTASIASETAASGSHTGGKVASAVVVDPINNSGVTDDATGQTGTIAVTLKDGGYTLADNDSITLTLTTAGTIAKGDATQSTVTVDATAKTVTIKRSTTWAAAKVKVTNGAAEVTYTINVTVADNTLGAASWAQNAGTTSISASAPTVSGTTITVDATGASADGTVTITPTLETGASFAESSPESAQFTYTQSTTNWTGDNVTINVVTPAGNTISYTVKHP